MRREVVVQDGQTIMDICVQEYGQIDNIFDIFDLNVGTDFDSVLSGNDVLIVNTENKGNIDVKGAYVRKNTKVKNG